VSVWVATACQLGAAQLDASFGLADGHVRKAERALKAEWHLAAATADHALGVVGVVGVAGSRLEPSEHPALRHDHIQEREPGMVDGAGGFDQLFGPGYRLGIFGSV